MDSLLKKPWTMKTYKNTNSDQKHLNFVCLIYNLLNHGENKIMTILSSPK